MVTGASTVPHFYCSLRSTIVSLATSTQILEGGIYAQSKARHQDIKNDSRAFCTESLRKRSLRFLPLTSRIGSAKAPSGECRHNRSMFCHRLAKAVSAMV